MSFDFLDPSTWAWFQAWCAVTTPLPTDPPGFCGVAAVKVSAFAAVTAAFIAIVSIAISFWATRKERRFSSIAKIKEWYDRNRENFEGVSHELDYGKLDYDPFKTEDQPKAGELLSFLSTLNEIAFLVHLGHARARDVRGTSLGYWYRRALKDDAVITKLAFLRVADRERGYRGDAFPYLMKVGPKISGVTTRRQLFKRVGKMAEDECFIIRVKKSLDNPKPASVRASTNAVAPIEASLEVKQAANMP